jgi:putative heme-binding domain-containing protein
LLELAQNAPAQSIRIRAIEVLGTYREPTIGPALLERFAEQTPAVRRAVLQALTRDPQRVRLLLAEIAAKRIAVAELDPARVRELTNHADPAIKKEAHALLAAALPADRKQVLESYQKALTLKADAQRGRLIFEKNCTSCHKIGNLGVDVAPDIADSRTKTPAALLTDILNPNQAIDNNYLSYTVATKEGKVLTGIIATETASSITLRQPENKTEIILRQDIEEMRSNGISLMPEGLEKNISIEQMADLIAFIKNWRYLDGQVPLSPAK